MRTSTLVPVLSIGAIIAVSLYQDQTRLKKYIRRRLFNFDSRMMKGEKILYAGITKYPGVDWEMIDPVGAIRLAFQPGGSFGAHFHIIKLEPSCTVINNCTVEIMSGTSCGDDIGDVYYDASKVVGNPFDDAFYRAIDSIAKGYFGLYTGLTYDNYVGKPIVINSQSKTKIGCGILQPWVPPGADEMIAEFDEYDPTLGTEIPKPAKIVGDVDEDEITLGRLNPNKN